MQKGIWPTASLRKKQRLSGGGSKICLNVLAGITYAEIKDEATAKGIRYIRGSEKGLNQHLVQREDVSSQTGTVPESGAVKQL